MAIYECPLCGQDESRLLYALPHTPKHHIVQRNHIISSLDFAPLQIVECTACGHFYNSAFDTSDVENIYVYSQITNAPVSPGMITAVAETAEQILAMRPGVRRVLEVGGGSGALALAIASRGIEVVMIEPNVHLDADKFLKHGVTLIPEMFPNKRLSQKFDLIICRQVLEHIPEPFKFMNAIRDLLDSDGCIYLEVPSADYILKNCSLVDFHLPHIQYFRQKVLTAWLQRHGCNVVKTFDIKDGHDAGYFLTKKLGSQIHRCTRPENALELPLDFRTDWRKFSTLRSQINECLRLLPAPIALYGATAYSQAFLGTWPSAGIELAFDDTEAYWSCSIYSAKGSVPIVRCDKKALSEVQTIIISAYLHDREILKKLRSHNYQGRVFTLRSRVANQFEDELSSLA